MASWGCTHSRCWCHPGLSLRLSLPRGQCGGVPLFSPTRGQPGHWGGGLQVAASPRAPARGWPCAAEPVLPRPRRSQGCLALPALSRRVGTAGPGDEAAAAIPRLRHEVLREGWYGAKTGDVPNEKELREAEGPFFPPVRPLSPCHPPGCCEASGGCFCSAPTSCLCRQLGLAGAVPDTHPPCWEGVNRSGCRQGSRDRAGLGLHPTTARSVWGVGSTGAGGRQGGD